jgi:hypothetical protein
VAEERWVDEEGYVRSRIFIHETPKDEIEDPEFA